MNNVYSPTGALLGKPADVARMLGCRPQSVYRAADVCPGGWRLRHVPCSGPGAKDRARIVLPDGRTAVGWAEAERLERVNRRWLQQCATPDEAGVWHVRGRR